MDTKEKFIEIEVPSSGKKGWYGGAWCTVFVYTSKGNFFLKGYRKECEDFILEKGWKCWAIFEMHSNGRSRKNVETFKTDFNIYSPYSFSDRKSSKDFKYTVLSKNESGRLYIKRLPKVFIDFDFVN